MLFDAIKKPLYRHVDADGLLTWPIWTSIEDIMPIQTLAVPGAIPMPMLSQSDVPSERPTQIAISPSSHLWLRCFWAF